MKIPVLILFLLSGCVPAPASDTNLIAKKVGDEILLRWYADSNVTCVIQTQVFTIDGPPGPWTGIYTNTGPGTCSTKFKNTKNPIFFRVIPAKK